MNLEYKILIAFALDLLIGDPRWLPHPVRGIGWLAIRLETICRRLIPPPRLAGIGVVLLLLGIIGFSSWWLLRLAEEIHVLVAEGAAVYLIYIAIASRDMVKHSIQVFHSLSRNDLPSARQNLGMIVGRDTENLDEPGVARATVESVAENMVDGTAAPLFFAFILGPIGAILYRTVNTLDSIFGYRSQRYLYFGWAAARLDDVINYIPARIAAPMICLAAASRGRGQMKNAWRILRRDGGNHGSPNSGLPEAAMAGALDIQLGGAVSYQGQAADHPKIGERQQEPRKEHILQANQIMLITVTLFLVLGLIARGILGRVL